VDPGLPARYAQVAVLAHLGRAGGLFTYGLPESLAPIVGPGSLVRVPFASRHLQGVVCSLASTCDLPHVRDIEEALDPVPVVTSHQLRLADWMSKYYAAPISDVLGAMLPPGLGRKTVYALEIGSDVGGSRLNLDQRSVLDIVRGAHRLLLEDVQAALPEVDVDRAVTSLARRGLLLKLAELAPPRVTARMVRVVSATSQGLQALEDAQSLKRAAAQRAVLEDIAKVGPVPVPDLTRRIPGAQAAVTALQKKGYVAVEHREMPRTPRHLQGHPATQPLRLAPAQRSAHEAIQISIRRGGSDIFLLHGVTGSGKTEVYLQAVSDVIAEGRQAIMMVPEISLTPQAVERVAGRFPGRVAVLHSKLSPGERLDEWQRIRHGEADVVVGPRSALFAPLPHPGLIVVDEEHDASYKQDSMPRYNSRDAAAVLGRLEGATVIFGSATPDVGTYYAAQSGRIKLLELPDRPVWEPAGLAEGAETARPMPAVEVVDMRHELKVGNRSIFSSSLMEAMEQTLTAGHQALLFLNRRGSATVVICRDCGYVVRCPECDIPYTYHASASRLICHRCDKRMVSPKLCPGCRGQRIRYLGVGTQRVEEEVRHLFPQARVLRWDRDVTGGKGAHEEIVRTFSRHEADVLVGTQMIAKGLDFPLVTLVGVISADTGLHMPDFRAPERSFQLLTQVSGRAGRASLPSRVVVQTYTPDHYAVEAAREHDYDRFYREEMSFRRSALYPPFARLIRFVYANERESLCRQSAGNLRSILEKAIAQEDLTGAEIIGPAPCFVARMKNRYYWQIIARGRSDGNSSLHPLLDYIPPGWSIDVDPVDLL
jgi:primosomal protein N' (replication factor Y) (superfamily II helicase)